MKMFFDVSSLAAEPLSEVGLYTKHLFLHLKKLSDTSVFPVCSASRWHRRSPIEKHLGSNVTSSLIVPHLPFELKLLHSPDHHKISIPAHIKVQTIHDLSLLEEEDYADPRLQKSFKKRTDEILLNSKVDQVIAVSYFIKSRLLQYYPHLNGRIRVIPSGSNHIPMREGQTKVFPWPYLLTVGALELKKNILGLLEAFNFLAPQFPELRLVLVGAEGYGSSKILSRIDSHPYKNRILWKKSIPEYQMGDVYRFAEVFVAPSFYEGFGFSILEAMRHRCPVVCSAIPSLIELGGEGLRTFSPQDPQEIAHVLGGVLTNSHERSVLKNLGTLNTEKFNWQLTAKKTWDVYMDLLRDRLREGLPSSQWESAAFGGFW